MADGPTGTTVVTMIGPPVAIIKNLKKIKITKIIIKLLKLLLELCALIVWGVNGLEGGTPPTASK